VRLPREISPGAAARRSLLADAGLALALALGAFSLAAGIGVVGFAALVVLVILLGWIGVEAAIRRHRGRGKS
jgi:NhaP-type Na+/H+ or K+/H+ antiporter